MKTTPIYGWPYAEDVDPVKQFPAAVDEPRTLAIETSLNTYVGRDTGWRNVSSLLVNSFAGVVMLRRTGHMVTLGLNMVWRATAVTTPPVPVLGAAPAGFAIASQAGEAMLMATNLFDTFGGAIRANSLVQCTSTAGNWVVVGTWPANGRLSHVFVYPTNDVWPTTLPGSPA